ncbi:MAG TPA: helix-turn-helix domain-containing protein [Solirubrobacteraceae bacterium]|jgi:AcrR family transcriptional regulator|nr:helix-turn-helix domain-containing protein [Solirubrobacteraceae bacterium]
MSTEVSQERRTRSARQRARTRRKLTDAARTLIAEKGVEGLRISEITERADVALGSFYNHFESKDDLVAEVVADTIEAMAEAIEATMAGLEDPAEAVSFAARSYVRLVAENAELASLLVNLDRADAQFERAVLPYALGAISRGIDAGRFQVADPHLALIAIIGSTLAVMRAILDGRYEGDVDTLHAEGVLRAVGLTPEDAHAVATRELPALDAATHATD